MAKKISEYGDNANPQMRLTCGTYRHVPAIAVDFGDAALGKRNRFPLMIPMYVLAVVNDLGLAASSRILAGWPQGGPADILLSG
jgi:hypothetical protein